jgi:hypothetical protein
LRFTGISEKSREKQAAALLVYIAYLVQLHGCGEAIVPAVDAAAARRRVLSESFAVAAPQ